MSGSSGVAEIEAFIAEQKIDTQSDGWKTKVGKPPEASFGLRLVFALLFEPLRRRAQVGVDRVFYRSVADRGRQRHAVRSERIHEKQ